MTSGWMSEKQRKEAIREAKLAQERAYEQNVRLNRMNPRDPRLSEQTDRMVNEAQECGRKYAKWLKAQGRKIIIRENNS